MKKDASEIRARFIEDPDIEWTELGFSPSDSQFTIYTNTFLNNPPQGSDSSVRLEDHLLNMFVEILPVVVKLYASISELCLSAQTKFHEGTQSKTEEQVSQGKQKSTKGRLHLKNRSKVSRSKE